MTRRRTLSQSDTVIVDPVCAHRLLREPHIGDDGECLMCAMAERLAEIEADSAAAFATWYFIDCQGLDAGAAQKWLARFREEANR